jgi:hypothetical protein
MNTHRTLSLMAALLVTAGQALVFAVDTAATVQVPGRHHGSEAAPDAQPANGKVLSAAGLALRYPGWRGV